MEWTQGTFIKEKKNHICLSMISPKVSKILKRTYINVYTKNNLPLEHGKRKFPGKKYFSLSSILGWDSGGRKKREGKNGLNSQQFLFLAITELFYTLNLYHYKTYYLSSSESII